MALSKEEQKALDSLLKKKDAPEPPPVSRSISANIDLSDDKQIERAIKHGFLTAEEAEEAKEKNDDDDDDSDSKKKVTKPGDKRPRRKGYFD